MKMKTITVLGSSAPTNVRWTKLASIFKAEGYPMEYIGWNRDDTNFEKDDTFLKMKTIQKGGGMGNKNLPFLYLLFIIKLFFYLLFYRGLGKKIIYAVNLDTAMAVWAVSFFRKVTFVYDIWDELAISHNFPKSIENIIRKLDKKVRKRANFYIHVDENRISEIDNDNYIIIYNSPFDVKKDDKLPDYENTFAVTGWLNKTRGLQSIMEFAKNNPHIKFIVAGEFIQDEYKQKYLELGNVEYHSFMPQEQLFDFIANCRGIFSLYDATIPINRLAASNKLYDAMMLSIPVIVNKEILAADFVNKNNIGYVVDYNYNESWDIIKEFNLSETQEKGTRGRDKYLENFEFSSMVKKLLIPRIAEL